MKFKITKNIPENEKSSKLLITLAVLLLLAYVGIFVGGVFAGLNLSALISSVSTIPNEICLLIGACLISGLLRLFIAILCYFKVNVEVNISIMMNMFFWMYIVNIFVNKV